MSRFKWFALLFVFLTVLQLITSSSVSKTFSLSSSAIRRRSLAQADSEEHEEDDHLHEEEEHSNEISDGGWEELEANVKTDEEVWTLEDLTSIIEHIL